MEQGSGTEQPGADLESLVLKKITARIVPFSVALYFVSFLNRVNVGFAALTMNKDLGLTAEMFGVGAGIFYVGYLLFGLPSNLLLDRVGARRMISLMMLAWGALSGATAFITGPYSFYAMRFAVGLAEAGFFPGIILYLSYWFPARHRAGVTALFMAAAPLSNMVGAPISGALLEMNGLLHLKGWQWLFLLEAAPTVLLGVVAWFFLTDKPDQAAWLKHEERRWLVDEMARELAGKAGRSTVSVWSALRDLRVLGLALAYFGTSTGLYAVSIWTPLYLSRFGYSYVVLGLLTAIPNIVAVVGMIWWARSSDRRNERTLHCSIACIAAAAGMFAAGYASGVLLLIAGLSLAGFGISAAKPPLWSMPTQFLSGPAAAAAIALINAVGSVGGIVGPIVIGRLKMHAGNYSGGMIYVAATLVLSSLLVLFAAPKAAARPE
jgi:ACS family tartrate transporter-like MFS transporter